MLSKLNSLTPETAQVTQGDKHLLDISMLVEGEDVTCIAYAMRCTLGMSKMAEGFATFYLKDVNANLITARLFKLEDFMNSGFKVAAFEGRAVEFTARVQEFNGSLNLVINGATGITIYTGDFDYARFIGKIDSDLSLVSKIYSGVFPDKAFPSTMYQTLAIDFLAFGKVGAFAKMYEIAFMNLSSTCDMVANNSELLTVFFDVMHSYYSVLVNITKYKKLGKLLLYQEYASAEAKCEENIRLIVIDALHAILEGAKPMHLYAYLIAEAVKSATNTINLIHFYSTISLGSQSTCYLTDSLGEPTHGGGVTLLKY